MTDEQNKKPNIAWISGSYFVSHDILSKIKTKYKDAEYAEINTESSVHDLLLSLATKSLFYHAKIVIVKGIPELTDAEKKKVASLLEQLKSNILCIFFMIDESKYRSFYKIAEKQGKIYQNIEKITLQETETYIQTRLKLHNKSMCDDALRVFMQNLQIQADGKTIATDNIEQYLRKLVVYVAEKTEISSDDIISNVCFCDNYIIWNLLRECDNRNYEECLNCFSDSVRNSKNSITALSETLNMLLWKYRMLLSLKDNMASGLTQQEAIQKTSEIKRIAYDGVGIGSIVRESIVQTGPNKGSRSTIWSSHLCASACNSFYGKKPQIEIYSRKDLYLIVECLNDCMYLSRTCEYEAEAKLIADVILATICNTESAASYRMILKNLEQARKKYA